MVVWQCSHQVPFFKLHVILSIVPIRGNHFHFHFLKVGSENAHRLYHCSCQEKIFYTFIFSQSWKWECILVWTLFQEGRPRPAQPPVLISPPNLGNNFLQTFGRTKLPFSGAMISSTESSCAKPWNVFFAASRPQFPNIYGSLAGWSLFVKTSHRK